MMLELVNVLALLIFLTVTLTGIICLGILITLVITAFVEDEGDNTNEY